MAGRSKSFSIEIDATSGKVIRTGIDGATTREVPMENVTLAEKKDGAVIHHKLSHVPEYTVIHTKSSPGCVWIFILGKWVQICS